MQPEQFLEILENPQMITEEQTREISGIIKNYPYFQSARAIYLKGLKHSESVTYNNQLKITAAYTTDRSVLFDYIVSKEFNQNEISNSIKRNTENLKAIEVNDVEDISVNKSVTLDDTLKKQIKDTEGVLDPDLFEEKIEKEKVAQLPDQRIHPSKNKIKEFSSFSLDSAESKLKIGTPLEFSPQEKHSFGEWLNLTSIRPIDRNEKEVEEKNATVLKKQKSNAGLKDKKLQLIDKFLEKNPKIVPAKDYSPKPLLYRDEIQHEGLMTETLARIYLEQKNYEKAIQSYKILSLKYPEKSSFFADQIKAVRELQEKHN